VRPLNFTVMRDRYAQPLVAVLVVLGVTAGCVDHRKLIGARTLFDSSGQVDQAAYSAALQAKFPPGTPLSRLEDYVVSLKGDCYERAPGETWCEVVVRARFCEASMIGIDATTDGTVIKTVRVEPGGISC
jgi:hypothetical protein